MKTDKSKINLIIDILLWFALAAVTGIGGLIKYTLPSGADQRLAGETHVNYTLWGLDRHEWGDIHLYAGLFLIILLLLHLVLHQKMIVGIWKRMVPARTPRWIIGIGILIAGIALSCFFLLISPDKHTTDFDPVEGIHRPNRTTIDEENHEQQNRKGLGRRMTDER